MHIEFPIKFFSHFVPLELQTEVNQAFGEVFKKYSREERWSNIFDIGEWFVKRNNRIIHHFGENLYRVRKAKKIREYIIRNELTKHFIIPEKYICWIEIQQEFCVISKKIPLSQEIPARELTPIQARSLAELSLLGYSLDYKNLHFTPGGKVAIIDTKPKKRGIKKIDVFHLRDRDSLITRQMLLEVAELKLYCHNPDALQAIEEVANKCVAKTIVKLIQKIAFASLVICCTSYIGYFLVGEITLELSLIIGALVIKIFFLIKNIFDIKKLLEWSCEGLAGLEKMNIMAHKGLF